MTWILTEILHRWNCPVELYKMRANLKDRRTCLSKAVKEAWQGCQAASSTTVNPTNAELPPAEPTFMHPQEWIASLIEPRLAEIRYIPDPEADQAKLIGALPVPRP